MKDAIQKLCDAAKAEVNDILLAPSVDPEAPTGYVRRTWLEAEMRQRKAAALEVTERLFVEIERLYGPMAGALAREHCALLLAELAGTEVH